MADTGSFGTTDFDAAVFAQELLCVSLASGAIGGVASALIGGSGFSEMARPAFAKGSAIALSTAVGESIHTLLDRQQINPLKGTAMLMGPVLSGGANILINRAQIIRAPPENPFVSFAVGAGSEITGRFVSQYVVGKDSKFQQLPNS